MTHRFTVTIPDDRAPPRVVPLWWPGREDARDRSTLRVAVEGLVSENLDIGLTKRVSGELLVLIGLGFIWALIVVVGASLLGLGGLWIGVLIGGGFPLCMAPARWLSFRRKRWEIRTAILFAGLCASCGYDLEGVPAGVDGRTICPECDSAWRLGGVAGVAANGAGLRR